MKVIALLGFLLFAGLALVSQADACDMYCPERYDPVCGKELQQDGSWKQQEFSNSCFMFLENRCNGGQYIPCN